MLADSKYPTRMAKRGTVKRREQMRDLIKTHDEEQGKEIQARQKPMFEESTIPRENAYQAIEAPRVQTRPTTSSFDAFSQSMVG